MGYDKDYKLIVIHKTMHIYIQTYPIYSQYLRQLIKSNANNFIWNNEIGRRYNYSV